MFKIAIKRIILIFIVLILFRPAYASGSDSVVFAISPMASPVSTLSGYSEFIEYLSRRTGMNIVLKQRRKYAEINSLLKTGEAQFAYTCTGAYLSGRNEFGLEVLAVPVIDGNTTYKSYIIAKKGSGIADFSGLRGKVFAFTDPLSLSGRLYPLYLLVSMNEKEEDFFGKSFYTASHEKSIESVAYGFAKGAAVDSLIFEDLKRNRHPAIAEVNIIQVSPSYGIPPIVISPDTGKENRQKMLKALLRMSKDREGAGILKKLHIDKFVIPNPAIYYNAVKLKNQTIKATFLQ